MGIQEERKAFEEWYCANHPEHGANPCNDELLKAEIVAKWEVWQARAQAVPEGFVLVPKDSLKVALAWMNEDIDPWQMGGDSFAELYEHKPILEALIEAQEQE